LVLEPFCEFIGETLPEEVGVFVSSASVKHWAITLSLAFYGANQPLFAATMEREPIIGSEGAVGLTDVISAVSLGAGRLSLGVHGSYYQQAMNIAGTPAPGSDVTLFNGALGWGLSPWIDGYAALYAFQLQEPNQGSVGDLGTLVGGLKGTIPVPGASPVRLGLDLSVLGGVAGRTLNTNGYDGWAWAETRQESEVRVRLVQSLIFEGNDMAFRVHLNEGALIPVSGEHGSLLMNAAAFAFSPHPVATLALEVASRTSFRAPDKNDPFWITPSVYFAGPHVQLQLGSQFALNEERPTGPKRALEPWRVFAGLTVNVDFLAGARREAAEKARKDSLDQIALQSRAKQAEEMAQNLARKNYDDSVARVREQAQMRHRADSLAAVAAQEAEAARQKALADSLKLSETQKKLAEEKAARSDAEKQFLATGVLNLEALYFESGKAEISINSKPYLNVIGKMLEKYPKLQLEVGGHTDNIGKLASNMALSQARSDVVRIYLIGVANNLSGRIVAHGYGPSIPKSNNRTPEGRQINRRVEITVQNKAALKEYE
jgi:outer membrane protein OmpA-like peptidoglycan-associated protein